MRIEWTKNLSWLVIALVVLIGSILIFAYIRNNVTYKYFESASTRPSVNEFISPSFESFVEVEMDSLKFERLINDIKTRNILSIDGWGHQLGTDHFFVRGYNSYEKPFFRRLFSKFRFWYIVFEIEYVSKRVNIKSEWFDGDEQVPITIQDYEPEPNDNTRRHGQEINSELKEILNRL
jgi:hypothetical protein